MMIPAQVYIITQFIIVKNLGLYDSHMAIILISIFTAFGTFLCRQFFMTIPDSYIEAAKIDGAGHFYIFLKIILPLSKPVIATLVIFSFRFFWNDFFTPLIYLTSPQLKTLPIGIADFVTETFTYYGPQMAASFISVLPVIVVFFIAQKYIVEGVAASGIKG
jgi:multiple sugar transport system permease protein